MGVVLATGRDLQKGFGRAIGLAVTVLVAEADQPFVARAEQVISDEAKPLSAIRGESREGAGAIGPAVVVRVDQDANVARPGDDDPAMTVHGHRVDVVGEGVAGVLGHFKAWRRGQTGDGFGARLGDRSARRGESGGIVLRAGSRRCCGWSDSGCGGCCFGC